MYPLLVSLVEKSVCTPLRISVHYTRATKATYTKEAFPGIILSPGRPRFKKTVDSAIARAVSLGSGAKDAEPITGLLVAICGPVGLRDEVVRVVSEVDVEKRDRVGGVEVFEECVQTFSGRSLWDLIFLQGLWVVMHACTG